MPSSVAWISLHITILGWILTFVGTTAVYAAHQLVLRRKLVRQAGNEKGNGAHCTTTVISDVFAEWPLLSSCTTGLGTCLLFSGISMQHWVLVIPCTVTKCSVWVMIPSSASGSRDSICGTGPNLLMHTVHCISTMTFILASLATIQTLQNISQLHNPPYFDSDKHVILIICKTAICAGFLSMAVSMGRKNSIFVASEFVVLWFNGLAYAVHLASQLSMS